MIQSVLVFIFSIVIVVLASGFITYIYDIPESNLTKLGLVTKRLLQIPEKIFEVIFNLFVKEK